MSAILGDAGDPAIRTRGTVWICRELGKTDWTLVFGERAWLDRGGWPAWYLWCRAVGRSNQWIASGLIDCHGH